MTGKPKPRKSGRRLPRTCQEVDRLLPDYVAGLLPVEIAHDVTEHLLSCDRHRANNWEAVIRALRQATNKDAA